ncbi:WD40 repeat domain-containing protein [Streptomyces sp. NPDC054833]
MLPQQHEAAFVLAFVDFPAGEPLGEQVLGPSASPPRLAGGGRTGLHPDGARIATVGHDSSVRTLNTTSGALVQTQNVDAGWWEEKVAISPDGTWLATQTRPFIRIWDTGTGTVRTEISEVGMGNATAVSADGAWLATSVNDRGIQIWDTRTGALVRMMAHATDVIVSAVALSPDRTRLVVADYNGTLQIWDTITEALTLTLALDDQWVTGASFAPDGAQIATVDDTGAVRIWDTVTGDLLTLMRTDSSLYCCSWSPDGGALFVGGAAGLFGYTVHPGIRAT